MFCNTSRQYTIGLDMNTAEAMNPNKVEVLNQEIDPKGKTPSYHIMLADKTSFKYITIYRRIFQVDDLCFSPILLEMLSPFPRRQTRTVVVSRKQQEVSPPPLAKISQEKTSLQLPRSVDQLTAFSAQMDIAIEI
jgi:hypothetical protein